MRLEEKAFTQLVCHCTLIVPFLMLHSAGISHSVSLSLCTAFVLFVQYQMHLLAQVPLSCTAGCASYWAWGLCVSSGFPVVF